MDEGYRQLSFASVYKRQVSKLLRKGWSTFSQKEGGSSISLDV